MTSDPRRDPRLPKDWLPMRAPDRVMLLRLSPRRRAASELWFYVPTLAIALLLHAVGLPDPIPILVAFGVIAVWFLVSDRTRRALVENRSRDQQLAADDARADEIATHFGDGLTLLRKFPFGWPLACVLTLLVFALLGWQTGFPPPAVYVTAGLLLATGAATCIALRNSGEFGRLTAAGIELGGRTFPWREIRAIEPQYVRGWNWRSNSWWLRVSLADPLSTESMPRGGYWQFRRGGNRHELLVSMSRTRESPVVIYQLADQLRARHRPPH